WKRRRGCRPGHAHQVIQNDRRGEPMNQTIGHGAVGAALALFMTAGCGMDMDRDTGAEAQAIEAEGAACAVPGTLAYHLEQGPGKNAFSYDPIGALETRIKGQYRPRKG